MEKSAGRHALVSGWSMATSAASRMLAVHAASRGVLLHVPPLGILLHTLILHLNTPRQRAYREERQRWQLVAACLEHCELTLTSLRSGDCSCVDVTMGCKAKRKQWMVPALCGTFMLMLAWAPRLPTRLLTHPLTRLPCLPQCLRWRPTLPPPPPSSLRGWRCCSTCWVSPK